MKKVKINRTIRIYAGVVITAVALAYVPIGGYYFEPNLQYVLAQAAGISQQSNTEKTESQSEVQKEPVQTEEPSDAADSTDYNAEAAEGNVTENTDTEVSSSEVEETPVSTEAVASEESETIPNTEDAEEQQTENNMNTEQVSEAEAEAKTPIESSVPTELEFDESLLGSTAVVSVRQRYSELMATDGLKENASLNRIAQGVADGEFADVNTAVATLCDDSWAGLDITQSSAYAFALDDSDSAGLAETLKMYTSIGSEGADSFGCGIRFSQEGGYTKAYLICLACRMCR